MGLFSPVTEEEALKYVDKINTEMRAISASMHLNYNMIDGRNRNDCRKHYSNIISYTQKYERIKNSLSEFDRDMMMGATVDVWNGERVGLIMWEQYLRNVLSRLHQDINY
jgi:6-phosphogluconate dehydrogenase